MLYNIVISPIAVWHVYPPCQSCQEKPDEFWVRGECNIIGWTQSTELDHWLYKYKYLGGNILNKFSIDLIWFKYWQLILLMGDWEMGRVDFLSLCNISDIRSQFVLCWSLILFVAGLTELGESGGVGVGWLRVRVHQRTLTPLTPASLLTVIQATGYSNNRCGAGGGGGERKLGRPLRLMIVIWLELPVVAWEGKFLRKSLEGEMLLAVTGLAHCLYLPTSHSLGK